MAGIAPLLPLKLVDGWEEALAMTRTCKASFGAIPWSGTNKRICPFFTHCLMPFLVAVLTPATNADSSTMQLKTLRGGIPDVCMPDCMP